MKMGNIQMEIIANPVSINEAFKQWQLDELEELQRKRREDEAVKAVAESMLRTVRRLFRTWFHENYGLTLDLEWIEVKAKCDWTLDIVRGNKQQYYILLRDPEFKSTPAYDYIYIRYGWTFVVQDDEESPWESHLVACSKVYVLTAKESSWTVHNDYTSAYPVHYGTLMPALEDYYQTVRFYNRQMSVDANYDKEA